MRRFVDADEQERFERRDFDQIERQQVRFGGNIEVQFGTDLTFAAKIVRATMQPLKKREVGAVATQQVQRVRPAKKNPLVLGTVVQTKGSFFVKPCPQVRAVSRHIIPDGDEKVAESEKTRAQVNEWLQNHPQAVMYEREKLVPFTSRGTKTKTGFDVLGGSVEYEWSALAPHNAIYSMYHRHLFPTLRPQPAAAAEFSRMADRYFKWFAERWHKTFVPSSFDAVAWARDKPEWSLAKRRAYVQTILAQLGPGNGTWTRSFTSMVKSGQCYYGTDLTLDDGGFLTGRGDRPRNIFNPCQGLMGFLTGVQSVMWESIKKVEGGFVQGYSKGGLTQLFRSRVHECMKSISIDGSAFDSTQSSDMMAIVDDRFWEVVLPSLKAVLELSKAACPYFTASVEEVFQKLSEAVYDKNTVVFTRLAEIRHRDWPDEIWNVWRRDHGADTRRGFDRYYIESNFFFNEIKGTTFSGHPTKTTLGNTFRSLLYSYYYLERAGFYQPWKDDDKWVAAAGDDVVFFVDARHAERVAASILENTSRVKEGVVGLGQCVGEAFVREWWDVEFCSKWAFSPSGKVSDWHFYRDVQKALSTRVYYSKQNAYILRNPALHAKALLESLKCEKVSVILEDLFRYRLAVYEQKFGAVGDFDLNVLSDRLKFQFSWQDGGYQCEESILRRVGFGLSNLYSTILYRSVQVNSNLEIQRQAMYSGDLSVLCGGAVFSEDKVQDRSTLSYPSEGAYRGRLGRRRRRGRRLTSRKPVTDAVYIVCAEAPRPVITARDGVHTGDPPEISAELCSLSG